MSVERLAVLLALGLYGGLLALLDDKQEHPVIRRIFTRETLERWERRAQTSRGVRWQLDVLLSETREVAARHPERFLSKLRAVRRVWTDYLPTADSLGLLDGRHGRDVIGRLRSTDCENFRSAMSECLASWYLARVLGFSIVPRPAGRSGSRLEFAVSGPGFDMHAEVKAPRRDWPEEGASCGDESDMLQGALEAANKQFASGVHNLLIVVPRFRMPVHSERDQITTAFFGNLVYKWPVDPERGVIEDAGYDEFVPSGHFLKHYGWGDEAAAPRYRRVSAVLVIEETVGVSGIEHEALVVHNPFAEHSIPESIWGDIPQLVVRGESMEWTDGAPLL